MRNGISFAAGLLFAVGLSISGMTHPAKVIGFLDFFGSWDPALVFVMGGAVTTNLILLRLTGRLSAPLLDTSFYLPTRRDIDSHLILGAITFGVGWGLIGYCPGPALVSIATMGTDVLLFVGMMLVGMYLHSVWSNFQTKKGH